MHILHDNTLGRDNREKFIYLAGQCGQLVKFYNVEELCADRLKKFIQRIPYIKEARTTIGTFYKFLIMDVLDQSIEKTIYLDADIVVNLDIKEFWQIELGDKPLAAVPVFLQDKEISAGLHRVKRDFDLTGLGIVKLEDYFNAGVFLLNLKRLRNEEEQILDGLEFRGKHPEFRMFDQCVWNYCFSTQYLKLPAKYNREVIEVREQDGGIVEKKIYHYTANNSAWSFGMDINDSLNRLWMNYFINTPWFDTEAMGRLYSGFQQIHVGLKQSMIQISAIMSGKTRAFFAPPTSVDALKKIFYIRDDEQIIRAEDNESLKKLIDAMNASRGKKVFFIMIPFPFQILIQAGFEPGKDFINGLEFLSEAQGIPQDSYPLIKAM